MANGDQISLLTEAMYNRPRKLGLASPFEQLFIEQFNKMLANAFKKTIPLSFVVRHTSCQLTIGLLASQDLETSTRIDIAKTVLEVMKESYGIQASATINEIPEDGELLLYSFEQAYEVAYTISLENMETVRFVYNSCLELAQREKRKVAPFDLIDILCQFAEKSSEAGQWRTTVVCLDYAERMLLSYLAECDDRDLDMILILITHVGDTFCKATLPERAVNLALNAVTPNNLPNFTDKAQKRLQQLLVKAFTDWQEQSKRIWQHNLPIFDCAEALLNKQAA